MLQLTQRCSNFCTQSFYGFVRHYAIIRENTEKTYNRIIMQQKKLLKKLNFANSTTSVQVLGSGANGAPSSLFLSTDHVNYIFNCGEGSQRVSQEHHFKLAKVEHLFITNNSWRNIGGILGLLLTLQEIGLPKVMLHGSEEIAEFLNKSLMFTTFSKLKFSFASINESEPYKDSVLTIWYVPISKSNKNSRNQSSDTSEDLYDSNVNGKRVIDSKKTKRDVTNTEKRLKTETNVYSYICEIHPKRGKLSIQKCEELGVKIGPLLSNLKQGLDITKEDGTVVRSEDVCMQEGPKVTLIVVECPDEEYLESFVNHTKFSKYQQTASTEEGKDEKVYLFHFTPENIFNHPKYQSWIQKFPSNIQHIVLNDKNTCLGSEAVFKQQHVMNLLHPEIFPLLSEDSLKEEEEKTISENVHRAKTLQILRIHPKLMPIKTTQLFQSPQTYVDGIFDLEEFTDTLTELKAQINKKTEELELAKAPEFPRIVMLGTGSSTPNKVRNTSGILLRVDQNHNILLDCAEGSLCQIIRLYGNSGALNILRDTKAIFLSHKHADHHMGVIGLLKAREKVTMDKVYLLVPQELADWMSFYDKMDPISHLYTLVNNRHFMLNNHKVTMSYDHIFNKWLNIKQIDTVLVKHCKEAFGISVTLNNEQKIVYSGDAMPCQSLINLGQKCDLLIHEATMEDKLEHLALLKYHSTVSQAINVGKEMNAKFTLLTHFSQRYSKIPILSEVLDNVGLAYDNMDIKLSHLPLLPLFYPCLKILYSEHYDKMEKRTGRKFALIMKHAV
ncbi:ribonuclease Z [Lasioglossum baleicum]|uniref:ribonuclease Z n=1 Tax=Lasioglossum baleicum TaxID=434251 RepID=UPI003FCCAEEF